MRAITYEAFGEPSSLHLTDQPIPRVGPGEVRIRISHAGINPVDWKAMAGALDPLVEARFPVIPGWDAAGVVDAVGPDTPEFAIGDRVATYARKQILQAGTFAEYVSVLAEHVAATPDQVSDEVAGAVPLAGLTALRAIDALALAPGDRVLIHGASGGVGQLAAQMARARGAEVVGTARGANHDRLRVLGVTPVAYGDGLEQRLAALPGGGRFDAVADMVGGVLDTTLAVLRPGGRHSSIADDRVNAHGGHWIWVRPDGAALARVLGMAADGDLDVEVGRQMPLAETADALAANQAGQVRGKIVLTIG